MNTLTCKTISALTFFNEQLQNSPRQNVKSVLIMGHFGHSKPTIRRFLASESHEGTSQKFASVELRLFQRFSKHKRHREIVEIFFIRIVDFITRQFVVATRQKNQTFGHCHAGINFEHVNAEITTGVKPKKTNLFGIRECFLQISLDSFSGIVTYTATKIMHEMQRVGVKLLLPVPGTFHVFGIDFQTENFVIVQVVQ